LKKEIIRREAIKLKLQGKTYPETITFLKERFSYSVTRMTLINWMNRFDNSNWDLKDISSRPHNIHYKFTEKDRMNVVSLRKQEGYSSPITLLISSLLAS